MGHFVHYGEVNNVTIAIGWCIELYRGVLYQCIVEIQ